MFCLVSAHQRIEPGMNEMLVICESISEPLIFHHHKGNAVDEPPRFVRAIPIKVESAVEEGGGDAYYLDTCFDPQSLDDRDCTFPTVSCLPVAEFHQHCIGCHERCFDVGSREPHCLRVM